MTVQMKDLVRARLAASPLPQTLPTAEQFATVPQDEITDRVPQLSPAMLEALKEARQAFDQSDVGRELAARGPDMTPQEVMACVPKIAAIPEVQHAARLAQQPEALTGDAIGDGKIVKKLAEKYAPRALLIQFCAMGDLGLGASVYIGFALDLADLNRATVYVGGAISVGPDGIVAAGQGIGLTANAYNGMTGAGAGVDVGFAAVGGLWGDVSIGVNAPYWPVVTHLAPSNWVAVVYALEGIGLGADVYGSFTLTVLNETLPDIVQPPAAHSTTIYAITCIKRQDTSGKDELYFTVTVDDEPGKTYRYPLWDYFSIDEQDDGQGGTWNVGFTINFNSNCTITLWDDGGASSDDKIHEFSVSSGDIPAAGAYKTLSYDNGGGFAQNHVAYDVKLYTPSPV